MAMLQLGEVLVGHACDIIIIDNTALTFQTTAERLIHVSGVEQTSKWHAQ